LAALTLAKKDKSYVVVGNVVNILCDDGSTIVFNMTGCGDDVHVTCDGTSEVTIRDAKRNATYVAVRLCLDGSVLSVKDTRFPPWAHFLYHGGYTQQDERGEIEKLVNLLESDESLKIRSRDKYVVIIDGKLEPYFHNSVHEACEALQPEQRYLLVHIEDILTTPSVCALSAGGNVIQV
jgi:hypothetical protein